MDECIKREAFLKDIEERYCLPCKGAGKDHNGCMCRVCWVDDMCGDVIDAPAADVAPVVHCKDCRYWGDADGISTNVDGVRFARCRAHNYYVAGMHIGWCPADDDFCSYGAREDGDSDGE